jgi:fructuronate reductase
MLGTVRDRLAAGAEPRVISLAVAAWMVYVLKTPSLDDPQADRLKAAVAGASEPAAVVDALLGVESIFTPELRDSTVFRDLLIDHVNALTA